jgi:hypothetical protein
LSIKAEGKGREGRVRVGLPHMGMDNKRGGAAENLGEATTYNEMDMRSVARRVCG